MPERQARMLRWLEPNAREGRGGVVGPRLLSHDEQAHKAINRSWNRTLRVLPTRDGFRGDAEHLREVLGGVPEELPEKAHFGGRECGRPPRKVVRYTTVKPFNAGDSDFILPALAALPNFDAVKDHVRETRLDVAVGSAGDPNGTAAFHAFHGLFLHAVMTASSFGAALSGSCSCPRNATITVMRCVSLRYLQHPFSNLLTDIFPPRSTFTTSTLDIRSFAISAHACVVKVV